MITRERRGAILKLLASLGLILAPAPGARPQIDPHSPPGPSFHQSMRGAPETPHDAAYRQAVERMQWLSRESVNGPPNPWGRAGPKTAAEILELPAIRQNLLANRRTARLLQDPQLMEKLLAHPLLQEVLGHPATQGVLGNPEALDRMLSGRMMQSLLDQPASLQRLLDRPQAVQELLLHPAVPGELLVQFNGSRSPRSCGAIHARMHATLLRVFEPLGLHHVRLPPDLGIGEAIQRYQSLPEVEYAEPNYLYHALGVTPDDERFDELWGLMKIQAPEAWDSTQGDPNLVVASLDTGVDYRHPDLTNNMWRNPDEVPENGLDDDGNGYVDDVFGIDAYWDDTDPLDDEGHGTWTSGIFGAEGNNTIGVAGVCWRVQIMALKWLGPDGCGDLADAIDSLMYVQDMKDRGENIIATNNSWGTRNYARSLKRAMDEVAQRGIMHVCAAGNEGTDNDEIPIFPANYVTEPDTLISVAASDPQDNRTNLSNWGPRSVDLAAPGVNILSTRGGDYEIGHGTSGATAFVTGAVALLRAAHPSWSAERIKREILWGVDWPPQWSGLVRSEGRLNLWNSVNRLPVVTGVRPLEGATNVSPYAPLEIRFSQPMKKDTVQAALEIAPPVNIQKWKWPHSRHLICKTDPWTPLQTFQVTLAGTARSLAGKGLDGNRDGGGGDDFQWSFTVGPPPPPTCALIAPDEGERIGGLYTLQAEAAADPLTTIDGVSFEYSDGTWITHISYDLEDSEAGNWSHDGDRDEWEWGPPTAVDGPSGAHSGENCWGIDLDGQYNNNTNCWLEIPPLDLPPVTAGLKFWHWYEIEPDKPPVSYDHGYVELRAEGVTTWSNITPNTEGYYAGASGDWVQETIDLSGYSGQRVHIRFRFDSDNTITKLGWYIDDIEILGPEWTEIGPGALSSPGCWELEWDTTEVAEGTYTLLVTAVDGYGSSCQDASEDVVIHQDSPEMVLITPPEKARIAGIKPCEATAQPRAEGATMQKVAFYHRQSRDLLLYESRETEGTPFTTALDNLGLNYTFTDDFSVFNHLLEEGSWDLVLVNEDWWSLEDWGPLIDYVASGGRSILFYAALETEEELAAAFGAQPAVSFEKPQNVIRSIDHPIWTTPNNVPSPLTAGQELVLDDGDELLVRPGSLELAHFISGNAALVLANPGSSYRTLLLGFDPREHGTEDTDTDGQEDIQELIENSIAFLIPDLAWWVLIDTDTDDSDGWQVDWDTTEVADGAYLVRAEGEDSLGNIGTDTHRVTVDNTPPEISSLKAHPNPFTDSTKIQFDLSERAQVLLKIVKNGALVKKLIPWKWKHPGSKKKPWDGTDQAGVEVDDGVYKAKARAADAADNRSPWAAVKITKTGGGQIAWISPPPPQMQSGRRYRISWEIKGKGKVESTYLLSGTSGNPKALAWGKTEGRPNSAGAYQVLWPAAAPGKYSFVAVACIGGKRYYSPVVVSTVGF